jgi:hypothetical protein
VKDMSDKTEKVLKNALIIGGALAVTYLLVSQLGSGKKKKKSKAKIQLQAAPAPIDQMVEEEEETPSAFSAIGAKIADTATVMLLDIAKEALSEFLKTRQQKNADS